AWRGLGDQRMQAREACIERLVRPVGLAFQRRQRGIVGGGILPQVERGQVEAETLHPPQQATKGEAACVLAAVVGEAAVDQDEIGEEVVDTAVSGGGGGGGGRKARRHQFHQLPVR